MGYEPNPTDLYDPTQPNMGNTNYGNEDVRRTMSWNAANDARIDSRLFYVLKRKEDWGRCRWDPKDESLPKFWRISNVTDAQYCYTPEAANYVSAAYFVSIVITQMANNIISKTKTLSIAQQLMVNDVQYQGFLCELVVAILICYVKPIEIGLGGRRIATPHFGIPAMSYFMIMILYDETRKVLVREGIDRSIKGKVRYPGWMARNTIY